MTSMLAVIALIWGGGLTYTRGILVVIPATKTVLYSCYVNMASTSILPFCWLQAGMYYYAATELAKYGKLSLNSNYIKTKIKIIF